MNTVTNIVKMAENEWASANDFPSAFGAGIVAWIGLYWVVRGAMTVLRRKAGTSIEPAGEIGIAFSKTFAGVEQFLFYLAAVAGLQVFGFAVAGWFVMKSVSRYSRWQPSDASARTPTVSEPAQEAAVIKAQREAALAHNRFQIFVLGTGMSVAAGGVAGLIYHYVLYRLRA